MDPVLVALILVLGLCVAITLVKALCLHATRSRLMREEQPFVVYASVRRADEAEYIVRCAMERVKWLDLYGMCRLVCLNVNGDPEVEEILKKLVQKYPFAEIGTMQPRKNVL